MWLPHEVPVMSCHKRLYCYTHPLRQQQQHLLSRAAGRMVTTIYHQTEQQRTNGLYHYYHYYCLLITGRTVGLMLPLISQELFRHQGGWGDITHYSKAVEYMITLLPVFFFVCLFLFSYIFFLFHGDFFSTPYIFSCFFLSIVDFFFLLHFV